MAAAEILATGSTAANSTDQTVAAGTPVTYGLKGFATAEARVRILLKDDAGAYLDVGELTPYRASTVISAPGTYRFTRVAGATCGVFSG